MSFLFSFPMMIGVDLLSISRIGRIFRNPRFPKRILSNSEHFEYSSLNNDKERIAFLSIRWAVKEAAYKAAYPRKLSWKDISVFKVDNKPFINLPFSNLIPHISVSHESDFLIATVILLEKYNQQKI